MCFMSVTCFYFWSILPKYSSCIAVERASEDQGPNPHCGTLEKSLNFLASIDFAVKMRHHLILKVVALSEIHKYFKYFVHYKAISIHSLHTHLLSNYYAEGTFLGTENKGVNKKAKTLCPKERTFLWEG